MELTEENVRLAEIIDYCSDLLRVLDKKMTVRLKLSF